MGQITESFVQQMLVHCARKEMPPLTVWEAEQLACAWLEREHFRRQLQQAVERHAATVRRTHGTQAHERADWANGLPAGAGID